MFASHKCTLIYESRKSVKIFTLLSALIVATAVSTIRGDC